MDINGILRALNSPQLPQLMQSPIKDSYSMPLMKPPHSAVAQLVREHYNTPDRRMQVLNAPRDALLQKLANKRPYGVAPRSGKGGAFNVPRF
jgi:hypothetical protein